MWLSQAVCVNGFASPHICSHSKKPAMEADTEEEEKRTSADNLGRGGSGAIHATPLHRAGKYKALFIVRKKGGFRITLKSNHSYGSLPQKSLQSNAQIALIYALKQICKETS